MRISMEKEINISNTELGINFLIQYLTVLLIFVCTLENSYCLKSVFEAIELVFYGPILEFSSCNITIIMSGFCNSALKVSRKLIQCAPGLTATRKKPCICYAIFSIYQYCFIQKLV